MTDSDASFENENPQPDRVDRSDLCGLQRCDDRFVRDLHISLTGSGTRSEETREELEEMLSDEQIQAVKRSYLLCLSVSETIRRLHDDPTEPFECPVCGEERLIHLGDCDPEGDQ